VLHDGATAEHFEALARLPRRRSDDRRRDSSRCRGGGVALTKVLDALTFLADYPLVVTAAGGVAEKWMGVRRTSA